MSANANADLAFEREKWEDDLRLRERELALKEREQNLRAQEVEADIEEKKRSRWTSPLVLAVMAAALAALGNAGVAFINGYLQRSLEDARATSQHALETKRTDAQQGIEEAKAEAARILEALKTGHPDPAALNLKFLLDAGLIINRDRRTALASYLNQRQPGEGASLPTPSRDVSPRGDQGSARPSWRQENLVPYRVMPVVFGEPGDPGNLTTLNLPYPMRLAWDTTKQISSFAVHKKALPYFQKAFSLIHERGLQNEADLFGGCFDPRKIPGSERWSQHAWGVEIDLDPENNQLRWQVSRAKMDRRVVEAFEEAGFYWRGHLDYDAMSFSLSFKTVKEIAEKEGIKLDLAPEGLALQVPLK